MHVPFCQRKCPYCDFASVGVEETGTDAVEAYCRAVADEIAQRGPEAAGRKVDTVYFGGGTPSLLPPERLVDLLEAVRGAFEVRPNAEVSFEANPGTVGAEGLARLREAGFNRVSLGVQSLRADELDALGRIHDADDARAAYQHAREAGLVNVALDLMYGVPGQTTASWTATLEEVCAWGPEHVSTYELTLEPGTPLAEDVARGEVALPPEDCVVELYGLARGMLGDGGYSHYEISNFAKSGYECRHNLLYWRNEDYWAFGPAACSFVEGTRRTNVRDLEAYLHAHGNGGSLIAESERLPPERALGEALMLGLRLREGVSWRELRERYSADAAAHYSAELSDLQQLDLIGRSDERLWLTDRGVLFSNEVVARLL